MSNAPGNASGIAARIASGYARTDVRTDLRTYPKEPLISCSFVPRATRSTEKEYPPNQKAQGIDLILSRESRPSVAREYTHRRSGAHCERVGTAPRLTAGRTRQRGYLHDPGRGVCKAVVGSPVTSARETYPYPGLELITRAGDRRLPSSPLRSTFSWLPSCAGGFLAPRTLRDSRPHERKIREAIGQQKAGQPLNEPVPLGARATATSSGTKPARNVAAGTSGLKHHLALLDAAVQFWPWARAKDNPYYSIGAA